MARSDQPPASVWLLLLDCCPFPAMENQGTATADRTDWHPFDDLDAEALFFEQYYSQHPTPECSVTEYLGGPEACRRFLARMQAAGKYCRHAKLAPTLTGPSEFTVSRSGLSDDLSSDTNENGASIADLLVITATGGESFETLTTVLQRVRSLHASCGESAQQPILIITGFKGLSRSLPQHFAAACCETEIRVPLWILPLNRRNARIQMLCGSNDLLPTISELLALPAEPEPPAPPQDPTAPLLLTPLSLLLISQLHPESLQRMLTISGDGWTGLRTQQYFLVRPDSCQSGEQDLENCSLYQKPDDFWNVNNSISACEEIARAMLETAIAPPT